MKKFFALVIISLLLVPVVASANILTFRYGYLVPRFSGGPDSLWNIEFENMSLKKADYQSGMLGLAYEYFLNRNLSLVFSLDFYSRNKGGFYKDWTMFNYSDYDFAFPAQNYSNGELIIHSFEVSQTPIQVSLKVTPLGRRVRVVPYFGGGLGIYFWTVRIHGNMVDFSDPWIYDDPDLGQVTVYPVNYTLAEENNRLSLGYNAFGGVMIPIGNRITLDLGVRYQFFKATFRDAFEGFEKFDLSGYVLTVGFNYWF
jgi:opacity protein-like surface antigen